jgi:hypothetical protein
MKSIVFHNREKIFSVSKYLNSNASSLFGGICELAPQKTYHADLY